MSAIAEPARPAPEQAIGKWAATMTVMLGMMATILSSTMVNVAIPDIMGTFGVGQDRAHWMSSGFLSAMTGLSRSASLAIAQKFPWENYKTFVDVGAAQGDLAVQVALAHSHLSCVGFDLPEVAPIFEEYVEHNVLSGRLRFQGGNFFEEPLPKADVVTMGHILHDWDLDQKRMLVGRAYEAIPEGGAFVAFDAMIDDDRSKNAFGLMMSLNMLIETPGGFDYTGADCQGWMQEAGFRETKLVPLAGPDSMVIGIK